MRITSSRKNRSLRKRPFRISSVRSLFVAAITRTSTRVPVSPPSGSTTCSSRTRSIFACVLGVMSPTSSRKSVPPSAARNFPALLPTAPVNAPRACPNSSLSISSSGIAAQFISTKGPAAPTLWACTLRATSSLPVPFAPTIRTRPFVGAATSIWFRSWVIARLSPSRTDRRSTCARNSRFSTSRRRCRSAFRVTSNALSRENGFSRKSKAPILIARTADSMFPWPETTTTCASTRRLRNASRVARPSRPGSQTSSKITS